jgi:hypothetical protein
MNNAKDFYAAVAVLTQFIELADKNVPIENKLTETEEENNHGS